MKQMFAIAIIVIAGLVLYHYYQSNTDETEYAEEEDVELQEQVYQEELPSMPESCQKASATADNAMYGAQTHGASFAQRNRAVRKFKSCLREAGLSDGQVSALMEAKKEKIKRYLEMDAKG